uniref:Uncharacterized protein n=1 Tax=Globodera rostochiensis TaxID=31243 RepID=A0A914HK38_GLORO
MIVVSKIPKEPRASMRPFTRAARLLKLIPPERALLVADLQEKFREQIKYFQQTVQATWCLIEEAKLRDFYWTTVVFKQSLRIGGRLVKYQILFAVAESQHVLLDLARRTYHDWLPKSVVSAFHRPLVVLPSSSGRRRNRVIAPEAQQQRVTHGIQQQRRDATASVPMPSIGF